MTLDQRSLVLFAGSSLVPAGSSIPQATIVFEYNPTSDANLPGINAADNSPVLAATDMTGNGHTGAPPVSPAGAGPDRKIAAINGVNCFNFIQANLDSLLVGTGLTFSSGVYAIGMDGVFQFNDFSQAYVILRVYTETGNGQRFNVQVTTAGKITVVSRRMFTDSNSTATSTIGLTIGVASFVSVQVDYAAGSVRIVIDGQSEILSATWASGTGPTSATASNSVPSIGRVPASSVAMNAYVGNFRCWTASMPITAVQARRLVMQAQFATPLTTVAVNPPASVLAYNRFYRAVAGSASVAVSGTVIIGGDASIQMRLLDAASLVPSGGWSTITTSVALAWSATVTVPAGSWFAQFRKVGERDVDAATDVTNRIGVGFVVLAIGLSNIQKQWSGANKFNPYPVPLPTPTTSTSLGARRWSGYGYFTPQQTIKTDQNGIGTNEPYPPPLVPDGCAGNGLVNMCLQMQTAQGVPLCVLAYAIGGTDTSTWLAGNTGWQNILASINLAGGPGWNIDGTFLVSGEGDARDGTSYATYLATLGTIHNQLRSVTGNPNTKLWLSAPGPSITSTTTNASMNAILDATLQYVANDPDALFAYSPRDIPLSADGQHPAREAYQDYMGPRLILTFRHDLGLAAGSGVGPEITGGSASIGSNSFTLNTTLHNGTMLVDGSGSPTGTGLTGLEIVVDGTSRNIVTASLSTGTTISGTFDGAAIVAFFDIGNDRGREPNTANPIRDNGTVPGSSVGSPLQPTNGLIRILAT